MKILICLVILVVLLLLVRIRFLVSYDEEGMVAYLKILFFKIKIPPDKKKVKGSPKIEAPKAESKGGSLNKLKEIIMPAIKTLGKAIRAIRIDKLYGRITIASDDAFKTAMMFGASAAGSGILLPIMENNFKIRKKDIEVNADFEITESIAKLAARISIAVWQVIILGFVFVFNYMKYKKGTI